MTVELQTNPIKFLENQLSNNVTFTSKLTINQIAMTQRKLHIPAHDYADYRKCFFPDPAMCICNLVSKLVLTKVVDTLRIKSSMMKDVAGKGNHMTSNNQLL